MAVNFAGAVLYALVKAVRKERAGVAVFFIVLPGFGYIIYFLPRLIHRLAGRETYDRDSLVKRFQIEQAAEHPDVQRELGIVPVEDAMAVSGTAEKRALLLNQLKKDVGENYKALLAAENDEDSESAHYVAAAKMEAYRVQQQRWMESYKAYQREPADPANFHAACTALRNLIDGRILSPREQEIYKKTYCGLIESQEEQDAKMLSGEDYEVYLVYLVESGQTQKAERIWNEEREKVKSERCYMKMIEMYYQQRNKEKFRQCMKELRADKQVRLSAQGLEVLRYWMQRE